MKFIAHRGKDHHSFYENSLEAFLWCLKQDYIDGIELDIRMTKDHQFILSHNSTILYLGTPIFIFKENLETLVTWNLGSIKNPHYLCSLDSLLSQVTSSKILLIELKEELGREKEYVESLLPILKKYEHLNIYLMSFNYQLVKLLTTMCKFPIGLLISEFINLKKEKDSFSFLAVSRNIYSKVQHPSKKMVWTVNQKEELKNYPQDLFIITDKAYHLLSKSRYQ